MSRRSLGTLIALVLLVIAAGAAGVGSSAVDSAGVTEESRAVTAAVDTHTPTPKTPRDPANMTLHLRVQADGDARWRVSATYEIRDDAEAAAFDDLAADFEAGEVPLVLDTLAYARANASEATGREMSFRNIQRTASRNGAGMGTLTLAFTWSNFAHLDGDRIYVGDAFNSTQGTWLPRLSARQTLVVEPPDGYGVVSAPGVGIVDGTARWEGPYQFEGREPWIVYSGEAPATTVEPTVSPTSPGTTPPPTTTPVDNGGLSSILPVALLVILAALSAVFLAVYMHRGDRPGGAAAKPNERVDDGGAAVDAETAGEESGASAPEEAAEGTAEPPPADESAVETAAGATAGQGVDEELLSDEERVERLLEGNGGRMKQANIVKETGWSNAKVSQLLSAMAEDDRIDKLRIGRENLISFPEEDVADLTGDDED
jgi:uncharacterized membrane protein